MQFVPLSTQPVIFQQQFTVGAKIYVYDAGTSNPREAFKDGSDTPEAWTQPILSDANGCIPEIWIEGSTAYRIRVTTAAGVQIRDIDNIPGETATDTGAGVADAGYDLTTGDILFRFDAAEKSGFVKLNGKSLGSGTSGADNSSDGNQALYILLYNNCPNLTVATGRGASALADFQSGKPLSLPDARGRAPFGLDTMGNSAASVISGVTFNGSGASNILASLMGEAAHALTSAENGPHTHTGSTTGANGTADTGTTNSSGAHTHTGTTDNESAHTHNYTKPASAAISGSPGGAIFAAIDITPSTGAGTPHGHTFTTASGGAHTHTTSVDTVNHGHTLTTASSGSGTAHNNMPPGILLTWYIRV